MNHELYKTSTEDSFLKALGPYRITLTSEQYFDVVKPKEANEWWQGVQQQNREPIQDMSEILGPVPPEGEESADEFIADIRRWREEDKIWE